MRIVVDVMGGITARKLLLMALGWPWNPRPVSPSFISPDARTKSKLPCPGLAATIRASKSSTPAKSSRWRTKPVEGLRRKKDSSILRAVDLLKDGKADALISPGNTGGIVAASTIRLRPLAGLDRPCIATVIPAPENEFVLLDSGASVECRPRHLLDFAIMGSVYSREILGYKSPRVGILSNGTEPNKGTELTIEACKLCQQVNLNFIGNVEGHDLFHNRVDVGSVRRVCRQHRVKDTGELFQGPGRLAQD